MACLSGLRWAQHVDDLLLYIGLQFGSSHGLPKNAFWQERASIGRSRTTGSWTIWSEADGRQRHSVRKVVIAVEPFLNGFRHRGCILEAPHHCDGHGLDGGSWSSGLLPEGLCLGDSVPEGQRESSVDLGHLLVLAVGGAPPPADESAIVVDCG